MTALIQPGDRRELKQADTESEEERAKEKLKKAKKKESCE
jgi:hypothetical protein